MRRGWGSTTTRGLSSVPMPSRGTGYLREWSRLDKAPAACLSSQLVSTGRIETGPRAASSSGEHVNAATKDVELTDQPQVVPAPCRSGRNGSVTRGVRVGGDCRADHCGNPA